MKRYDLTQIDFLSLKFPRKTKAFKTVCQLYCDCQYDKAEELSKKLTDHAPQIADMQAQTAFFHGDFNKCVEQIMLFYPFLIEWYSGNKKWETEKMLEFALQKADTSVKQETIERLTEMYRFFTPEQLQSRGFEHFQYIPTLIEHANGQLETFANPYHIYSPPQNPERADEIFSDYLSRNRKRLAKLSCVPQDDPSTIGEILLQLFNRGYPEEFLSLYEKHCTSPLLIYQHLNVVKIYIYLKQPEKAQNALLNYAKYGWIPIEWTDVKPVSMFLDYSFVPLFTKELFDAIYQTPVFKR